MLLTTLLAAAVLSSGTPLAAPVQQNTSAATAEGTEILRRILVDTLDESFADKSDGAKVTTRMQGLHGFGTVTGLWANEQTVQHSRAFHVPDAGLFFALDAALPVVATEKAPESEKSSDQPTDDEWERARREVRGQGSPEGVLFRRLRFSTPTPAEIDPKAIDQVIDVVLRTAARHATRIEGLTPRETLTVAVRLSGKSRTLFQEYGQGPGGLELDFGKGEGERDIEAKPGETISAYVLATGQEVREQNLVIRITLGDLTGLGDAGLSDANIAKLRQRAQINRY